MVCPWKEAFHKVSLAIRSQACTTNVHESHNNVLPYIRTGYERHMKAYKSPVQSSAGILRGVPGADGVDMEGKVVVITG